jgi:hypothetical protein
VIEGFFGSPWPDPQRLAMLPWLAARGFDLFLHAPKADRHLRGRWHQRHPSADEDRIRALVRAGEDHDIDIALGLSPLALVERWHTDGPVQLLRRVDELRALGVHGLGLFFDDMRGDLPALAATQGAMVQAVRAAHPDLPLWMCPTYYTPHDVLDRVFGPRPPHYLETLGEALPDDVEVFWTGERVCSASYTPEHLEATTARLGRPVAIWDNYPVNDGPRMCKHLHLRPPGGRPPALLPHVSTWCINPMNQLHASKLPMAAIVDHLHGRSVDLPALAARIHDEPTASALLQWMDRFQDLGLDALDDRTRADAIACFDPLHDPVAAEIVGWLKGDYLVGPECLTDTED